MPVRLSPAKRQLSRLTLFVNVFVSILLPERDLLVPSAYALFFIQLPFLAEAESTSWKASANRTACLGRPLKSFLYLDEKRKDRIPAFLSVRPVSLPIGYVVYGYSGSISIVCFMP